MAPKTHRTVPNAKANLLEKTVSSPVTTTPVTKSAVKPSMQPVPVKTAQHKLTTGSSETATGEQSTSTEVNVKARKSTLPVPTATKKQTRADEPAPEIQPPQKKPKAPANQPEASRRAAEEEKWKLAADAADKRLKASEEAQAHAKAVERRKAALEATRKKLEEEETKMAEEEEALAASMASKELPEEAAPLTIKFAEDFKVTPDEQEDEDVNDKEEVPETPLQSVAQLEEVDQLMNDQGNTDLEENILEGIDQSEQAIEGEEVTFQNQEGNDPE